MASITRQVSQDYFKELVYRKRKDMAPAQRRRKPSLTLPATWLYPWAVERMYSAYLKGLMARLSEGVVASIGENLARWLEETSILDAADSAFMDEYEEEFEQLMEDLRETQNEIFIEDKDEVKAEIFGYGGAVNEVNRDQWDKVTTLAIGNAFDVDTGYVTQVLRSWTNLNYTLVASLGDEYIKKINFIVAEGVQQGSTYTDIMDQLQANDKTMTKNRAELIARDQIGKLNGSLTEGRLVDAGVNGYIWSTALDERVRQSHRQLNGSENKWEDRSVYKPRGAEDFKKRPSVSQGLIPGSDIQCRCTALPAFDDIVAEVDEFIALEEARDPSLAFTDTPPPTLAEFSASKRN